MKALKLKLLFVLFMAACNNKDDKYAMQEAARKFNHLEVIDLSLTEVELEDNSYPPRNRKPIKITLETQIDNLIGKWQSFDDSKTRVEFVHNRKIDFYDNVVKNESTISMKKDTLVTGDKLFYQFGFDNKDTLFLFQLENGDLKISKYKRIR